MGLKYYGSMTENLLIDLIFEYGTLTKAQLDKILCGYSIKEVDRRSMIMKVQRNPCICVSEKSQILEELAGEQDTDADKLFASDFANRASRVRAVERSVWVLIDYIFEVDYHFCCNDVRQGGGPSLCFGTGNRHYEVFYIPKGQEDFFNIMFSAYAKEMICKTGLARENGWCDEDSENSLLSTERFIALDAPEQISLLDVPNVLSYCLIGEDNKIDYRKVATQ